MDRRKFITSSLALTAAVAGSSLFGSAISSAAENPSTKEKSKGKAEKKKMKILVLTGSPRKNGNSSALADHFIQGATEAGHEVARFDAAFKNVHPCTGCNHCGMDGPCAFKDDFEFVREHILPAQVVAFATPMYYFGISAQLKAVIDRFYAINGQIHVPKRGVLLMTYANTAASHAKPIIAHYEALIDYLGWQDAGQIIAPGVWSVGAIHRTSYPKKAYQLGREL